MARELTPGQKAAGRAARARRGELKLSQSELAELAVDVSIRTIRSFENGERWPQPHNLVAIERSLGWRAGHLSEFAATQDTRPQPTPTRLDDDIHAIMESNMDVAMKLRLIDRLRGIDYDDGGDHESDIDAGIA